MNSAICRDQGFKTCLSPDFFQASSFQLLKLENLLWWSFFTFIYNLSSNMNYFIYNSHHFTPHRKISTKQVDLAPNVWLHSSVGKASHWYSQKSQVRILLKPSFFQASSFELLKLENYCDDHSSLSSTTAVQIWNISYILWTTVMFHVDWSGINPSRFPQVNKNVKNDFNMYITQIPNHNPSLFLPVMHFTRN